MEHREFLRIQGAKGGKAGRGIKKIRGDSAYYSQLAKKRGKGAKSTVKKHARGL